LKKLQFHPDLFDFEGRILWLNQPTH